MKLYKILENTAGIVSETQYYHMNKNLFVSHADST